MQSDGKRRADRTMSNTHRLLQMNDSAAAVLGLAVHEPWQPHNAHLGRQWTWTNSQHECRENNAENVCCNAKMAAKKGSAPTAASKPPLPMRWGTLDDKSPINNWHNTNHTHTPAGGSGAKTWAAAVWLLPCPEPQKPQPQNHQAPANLSAPATDYVTCTY